ncbi:hypothetical protein V2J09_009099 [Rumex salicifolius]
MASNTQGISDASFAISSSKAANLKATIGSVGRRQEVFRPFSELVQDGDGHGMLRTPLGDTLELSTSSAMSINGAVLPPENNGTLIQLLQLGREQFGENSVVSLAIFYSSRAGFVVDAHSGPCPHTHNAENPRSFGYFPLNPSKSLTFVFAKFLHLRSPRRSLSVSLPLPPPLDIWDFMFKLFGKTIPGLVSFDDKFRACNSAF